MGAYKPFFPCGHNFDNICITHLSKDILSFPRMFANLSNLYSVRSDINSPNFANNTRLVPKNPPGKRSEGTGGG